MANKKVTSGCFIYLGFCWNKYYSVWSDYWIGNKDTLYNSLKTGCRVTCITMNGNDILILLQFYVCQFLVEDIVSKSGVPHLPPTTDLQKTPIELNLRILHLQIICNYLNTEEGFRELTIYFNKGSTEIASLRAL